MSAVILSHITDLSTLDDEQVAQFARELPALVAALRIASSTAKELGTDLSSMIPRLAFVPEMGDKIAINSEGKRIAEFSHAEMIEADHGDHRNVQKSIAPKP